MTTYTYTAADELDRRATNRALKAQGLPKVLGPNTPEGKRLCSLDAKALRAEAGIAEPVRTPKAKAPKAPKAERTPEQKAQTAARKLAWATYIAAQAAGEKLTYAEACEMHGTMPAKAAKGA